MRLQYHLRNASKMPERLRSPHLTKRATCAEKKQHDRRRVSCEREREMPLRRQPALFAGRCPRLLQRSARMAAASSEMRVVSCVKPRRSQTIGSGPRKVRGASDSFTLLTVSRRERERSRKGGSHSHATPATLCRKSGQILVCSVLCNSSADLLVGTTSRDHRMRNGAKSGKARSGVTWTCQIW